MISVQPRSTDNAAFVFSLALHLRSLLHTNGSDSREQLFGQGLNDIVNCEQTEIVPLLGRFLH